MRRTWVLGGAVGGVLILAGCTSQTPGIATEVSLAPPTTSSRAESGGPSTAQPVSIKPCSLLSAADVAELGITTAGKPNETKGSATCLWRVEKPLAAESYDVGVTYYKQRGVDDLVTEHTREPVQVGKHKGVKALGDTDSGCIIALGITATSRVDVRAIGGDSAGLCGAAMAAAERVETRLP
ncbi:DUF3558 domain-containing protein [Actinokineospora globicatena]|uniref:DUF3558 domain-containing protein n=1 Tax=Actinokineospora globicatena TaxID=103729 RepID=A0A9W6V6Z0_9PSEU|nr:DUF3558 domain-containing protein [Actinokineospora globicatena]GLW90857.1 hypothetical protein Aglo03_16730 [Actinokineospora globicatena]